MRIYRESNKTSINAARRSNKDVLSTASWHRSLRKKYGLLPADYDRLLVSQDARCAICKTDKPWTRSSRFAVDHDHVTGCVRGLLCQKCNQAIGLFDDSPEVLRKAAEYLVHHRNLLRLKSG